MTEQRRKGKPREWIWMPHPGHLCVSNNCRFHLNTYVNGYIVSTVGEYFPDSKVREIFAKSRGKFIKGRGDEWDQNYMNAIGYEEIGCGRKYETMVFKAVAAKDKCCPFHQDGSDLDMDGYNDADSATEGHYKMCRKWESRRTK